MKIGLLTFLDVANFGANLQAASTYNYLKNHGYQVEAINYQSYKSSIENRLRVYKRNLCHQDMPVQNKAHQIFVSQEIDCQSPLLHTSSQVARYIRDGGFDGIIIGSDAVAQHWPWLSTIRAGTHRPFWIEPLQRERRFPNPFWGEGFAKEVPTAMMSVSSQNSKYKKFSKYTLKAMSEHLKRMRYISVRDEWTRQMMLEANTDLNITVTPDPVFALNQNLGQKIPSEQYIRKKFRLPEQFVLIGLRSQVLSFEELTRLNDLMWKQGKSCVAFSIDGRYSYRHPFKYEIPLPLMPLEWFALIKYSSGYIGSNMHPMVSALTNAVPCFSLDNWGMVDFWGHKTRQSASSKVFDVLSQYGLTDYRAEIDNGRCHVAPERIVAMLHDFPVEDVRRVSVQRLDRYNQMMQDIIQSFGK